VSRMLDENGVEDGVEVELRQSCDQLHPDQLGIDFPDLINEIAEERKSVGLDNPDSVELMLCLYSDGSYASARAGDNPKLRLNLLALDDSAVKDVGIALGDIARAHEVFSTSFDYFTSEQQLLDFLQSPDSFLREKRQDYDDREWEVRKKAPAVLYDIDFERELESLQADKDEMLSDLNELAGKTSDAFSHPSSRLKDQLKEKMHHELDHLSWSGTKYNLNNDQLLEEAMNCCLEAYVLQKVEDWDAEEIRHKLDGGLTARILSEATALGYSASQLDNKYSFRDLSSDLECLVEPGYRNFLFLSLFLDYVAEGKLNWEDEAEISDLKIAGYEDENLVGRGKEFETDLSSRLEQYQNRASVACDAISTAFAADPSRIERAKETESYQEFIAVCDTGRD